MSAAAAWLRGRLPDAPPQLVRVMMAALPDEPRGSVAETLAEGALTLYRQVLAGTGGREDALPLLAADALFTHAFDAQAILDPGGLHRFAARWGGSGRLAELPLKGGA